MLVSVMENMDRRVHAMDGDLGRVEDFYFDDFLWKIHYVVVDTSAWLPGKHVLTLPDKVLFPERRQEKIVIAMTMDQIKASPGIESDPPEGLRTQIDPGRYPVWAVRERPIGIHLAAQEEGGASPRLRSAREVMHYSLHASDGDVGHVEDFLLETLNWPVRYLVVNTHRWIPGRKILISPQWVSSVDWNESRVDVAMSREEIRVSPEFDERKPISREYEEALHAHYGRDGYWPDESE